VQIMIGAHVGAAVLWFSTTVHCPKVLKQIGGVFSSWTPLQLTWSCNFCPSRICLKSLFLDCPFFLLWVSYGHVKLPSGRALQG
jgi:hypothetical protein